MARLIGILFLRFPLALVTRVVGLLNDLQARIEKDGESEQATFDKYARGTPGPCTSHAAPVEVMYEPTSLKKHQIQSVPTGSGRILFNLASESLQHL